MNYLLILLLINDQQQLTENSSYNRQGGLLNPGH